MPKPVVDAEARYQSELAANPKVRHQFEAIIVPEEVRRKAAMLIGATLEETALTHNTTEGLNIVVHGLPLKAADQVLITDQEHPGHREPWRLRAKRDGIEVTEVKIPTPLPDAAAFLNRIESAMTSRTRVIAFPYITTTTGLITPAKAVWALARSRGLWTLLDGAHSAGQIKFSVKDIGCDFYTTSPHKWLHAPLGNGIFYCRRELQNTLWPLTGAAGWDSFQDARKYSAFGNRSWATAMALGHAIDFANAIGIEHIEARQRALMTRFKRDLLAIGVESLTPADQRFTARSRRFGFRVYRGQTSRRTCWRSTRSSSPRARTASAQTSAITSASMSWRRRSASWPTRSARVISRRPPSSDERVRCRAVGCHALAVRTR
jgi:selenocysteine lyase/cysteine desulfurase